MVTLDEDHRTTTQVSIPTFTACLGDAPRLIRGHLNGEPQTAYGRSRLLYKLANATLTTLSLRLSRHCSHFWHSAMHQAPANFSFLARSQISCHPFHSTHFPSNVRDRMPDWRVLLS